MFNVKSTSTKSAVMALRRRSSPVLCAATLVAGTLVAAPFAHAANSYAITGLRFLPGGSGSYAYGINDSGQVVGGSTTSGSPHAFLYNSGATNPTMQDLGTISGGSISIAINASGQVVGYSGTIPHAFLYDSAAKNPTMQNLGELSGGSYSYAVGINASGQVVGDSITASGSDHAFLYSNGTMSDLNSLIPGYPKWTLYQAFAINTNGDIVGYGLDRAGGDQQAFLLTPIVAPEPATLALLALGGLGLLMKRRRVLRIVHWCR